MKNYPKITAAIVLVFVLVISIIVKQLVPLFVNNEEQTVSSQISSIATEQTNTEPIVSNTAEEEEEMRAVWVPFMSLTMSSESDKSEAAFQKKFDEIVKTSKEKRNEYTDCSGKTVWRCFLSFFFISMVTSFNGHTKGKTLVTILWNIW